MQPKTAQLAQQHACLVDLPAWQKLYSYAIDGWVWCQVARLGQTSYLGNPLICIGTAEIYIELAIATNGSLDSINKITIHLKNELNHIKSSAPSILSKTACLLIQHICTTGFILATKAFNPSEDACIAIASHNYINIKKFPAT